MRRHRLLECFLFDVVGIPWHQVHQEAIRLEPGLSPAFEARIEVLVGSAVSCPHGNPIPGQGCPPRDDMRLSCAPIGARFVITRIDEEAGEDACTLQLFSTRGLLPGTALLRLPDIQDDVAVRRADHQVTLSRRVAGLIWGECAPERAVVGAATLIGLAQIGLALLLGLLCWRLIVAARRAINERHRSTAALSGGYSMADETILPAELVAGAIEHMNADHADAVLAYAQVLAGLAWAQTAELTGSTSRAWS